MRNRVFLAALIGIGSAALFATSASAGDWGWGCGSCGYSGYAASRVYYAPPTYSYAAPTITVVPHYVVQPNYVVQRTYVVHPTRYINEGPRYVAGPAPCATACGRGLFVNQGQYATPAALVAAPVYGGYAAGYYAGGYRVGYVAPAHRYYHRRVYRHYRHYR